MKIPYGKQEILQEDIDAVIETLNSEFLTAGPRVDEFEKMVAAYHNAKHAIAFSNGTTALHAGYVAMGITEGDEVIGPDITFVATTNGAIFEGGVPKLCDIDLSTNVIDIEQIESLITPKTKCISPVSLAGYPVDLDRISAIAKKHNLYVMHDAAHAIGSRRNNSFQIEKADFTMFSFHPVKHVTTGEGGMLLTNDDELAKRARSFRAHGISRDKEEMAIYEGKWSYEMTEIGHNFRLSDIQSMLGITQFGRVEKNLLNRNLIAKRYNEAFKDMEELIIPPHFDLSQINEDTDVKTIENLNSYHLYTLRVEDKETRLALFNFLHENNIFVQVHYIPVHWHGFYAKNYGYKKEEFPNANEYYNTEISLPMYHALTKEEQEVVISKVKEFFANR